MQTTPNLSDQQPIDASQTAITKKNSAGSIELQSGVAPTNLPPDTREQLFNGGETGPIGEIQVSAARIVSLNAALFDLDPSNLRQGPLVAGLANGAGAMGAANTGITLVVETIVGHLVL